ncbi:MAG: tRNA-binding protein [Candidatus Micrarchaeota archaeon]|nr:tRNA-binding protein [Candidatus Micrarchaeota archaeon]
MPSITDFANFDIRVGRIAAVDEHTAARKPMYKLTVEFGGEIGARTVIAGIMDRYSKEELAGKKAVFIVNLDPKNIAGVESQGMLLAAEDGATVSVLVPDRDVAIGSKIH